MMYWLERNGFAITMTTLSLCLVVMVVCAMNDDARRVRMSQGHYYVTPNIQPTEPGDQIASR